MDRFPMPFGVLVWGPGEEPRTPYRVKREAIRDHLEALLGSGRVLFSEDADLADLREREGDFGAELLQVRTADAVVLIAESAGSLTKAALYGAELAGKTIVFTQQRRAGGFARAAYEHLKIIEVSEEEWTTCHRVRREAHVFVKQIQYRKFQHGF